MNIGPKSNPYASPPATLEDVPERERRQAAAAFFVLPVLGGLVGFSGLIATSLLFEEQSTTSGVRLSNGVLAALVSLPLCTLVGGALGFGLACAIARMPRAAIMIWVSAALLDGVVVAIFWTGQFRAYGLDRSDIVLFGPPLVFAFVAILAATLLSVVRWVRYPNGCGA